MRTDDAVGPRPVIAIHGIQGTRASWLPVVQASRAGLDWLLPDLRGRGSALRGRCREDYRLDGFVQDLRAMLRRLAPDQDFVLAGWSLGVSVVLQACLTLLEDKAPLPSALVLVSGTACLRRTQWFHAQDETALLDEIARRERRLGLIQAAGRQDVAWTWQANCHSDHRDQLQRIPVPALIIHGEQDEDCPLSHARMLADGLPCNTLHLLPEAGHGVLGSHAGAIAALMDDFCSAYLPRTRP
ncbi:MAG: alpha/beta fold hydrolase [Alcaligenes sp.]